MSPKRTAIVYSPPGTIAMVMIAVALIAGSAASGRAQQPVQSMPRRATVARACAPVQTPWPTATGRIDRVTTTAITLDRQWFSDPKRGEASLTKVLVGYPVLLRYAVINSASCTGSSCACPRAAKGSATTLGQTLDPALARDASTALTRLFREDSVSTFTGAMLFLREHPEFVRRVADSVSRASAARAAVRPTAPRPAATTPTRTRPPGA